MQTPFPPVETVTIVYLAESMFGFGYNRLVEYIHKHQIWDVSVSVALGVAVTISIPVAVWYSLDLKVWQFGLLLFGCFVFSGLPMMGGSIRRTVTEKESHKARPWPTRAAQARDDAVMALSALAEEISTAARESRITVQHLPDYVNRLHRIIGMLKSA